MLITFDCRRNVRIEFASEGVKCLPVLLIGRGPDMWASGRLFLLHDDAPAHSTTSTSFRVKKEMELEYHPILQVVNHVTFSYSFARRKR